jgi:hypothetical protein
MAVEKRNEAHCSFSGISAQQKLGIKSESIISNREGQLKREMPWLHPPITYYWTVPLILDNSYIVGKSTSSKIADTKVPGF